MGRVENLAKQLVLPTGGEIQLSITIPWLPSGWGHGLIQDNGWLVIRNDRHYSGYTSSPVAKQKAFKVNFPLAYSFNLVCLWWQS